MECSCTLLRKWIIQKIQKICCRCQHADAKRNAELLLLLLSVFIVVQRLAFRAIHHDCRFIVPRIAACSLTESLHDRDARCEDSDKFGWVQIVRPALDLSLRSSR